MNVFQSIARQLGLAPPEPPVGRPRGRIDPVPVPSPAPAAPPPAPRPSPPAPPPVRTFDPATTAARQLDVQRALGQCEFVARSYGVPLWTDTSGRSRWEADLLTMHLHDDLARLGLVLLDSAKAIVFEFWVDFGDTKSSVAVADSARGIELPVLARGTIATYSLQVINRVVEKTAYRHLLKLNWNPAPPLQSLTTERFESGHAGKISAGRQRAFVSVAGARRRLRVTHVSATGDYAFGRDAELAMDVFLHVSFAPAGFTFKPDATLTAVVVQTPRGAQGRNIALA